MTVRHEYELTLKVRFMAESHADARAAGCDLLAYLRLGLDASPYEQANRLASLDDDFRVERIHAAP